MTTTIRKLGAGLSRAYTVAVCGVAFLFGASSLHAQATRDLNRAATSVSAASTFFPPRVERDDARDRIWSLSEGEVLLYHGRARTWAKTIALRGWSSVGAQHSCAADIAVDVAGNVIVSSNIAPTLWRIDAKSLEAERLDIVLDADHDKDVDVVSCNPVRCIAQRHRRQVDPRGIERAETLGPLIRLPR